jgi:hypothetical protein
MHPPNPPRRGRLPARHKAVFDFEEMYRDLSPTSPFHPPQHSPFEPANDDIYTYPIKDPALLASRATALLRRCTALNATMAHLTSVIEPLKNVKPENVTDGHVLDMNYEAERVRQAFAELDSHISEVALIMEEVKRGKGKGKGKGKDDFKEVAWMGARGRRRTDFDYWS